MAGVARLSEHWFAPTDALPAASAALAAVGCGSGGHVIDSGTHTRSIRGVLVFARGDATIDETTEVDDVVLTVRRVGSMTWLHGRSVDRSLDLVQQTEQVMARIAATLPSLGLTWNDTAKCTAHYVGDDSPETLHGNLAVRNRHYAGSGLASTGLPVHGFADKRSLISVDCTFRT